MLLLALLLLELSILFALDAVIFASRDWQVDVPLRKEKKEAKKYVKRRIKIILN
jgi:hypothetical protein